MTQYFIYHVLEIVVIVVFANSSIDIVLHNTQFDQ